MDAKVSARQPPSSFHFPKWYTDYVGGADSGRQTYRLAFLRRDGTEARAGEPRRPQQPQFPALRPARTLPDGFAEPSRSQRQPLLPVVVPLGKQPPPQSLKLPSPTKCKSFAATGAAHPALYSSIRAVQGAARLHAWQRAVDTIPSVESVRQNIRLPPILIKKLA